VLKGNPFPQEKDTIKDPKAQAEYRDHVLQTLHSLTHLVSICIGHRYKALLPVKCLNFLCSLLAMQDDTTVEKRSKSKTERRLIASQGEGSKVEESAITQQATEMLDQLEEFKKKHNIKSVTAEETAFMVGLNSSSVSNDSGANDQHANINVKGEESHSVHPSLNQEESATNKVTSRPSSAIGRSSRLSSASGNRGSQNPLMQQRPVSARKGNRTTSTVIDADTYHKKAQYVDFCIWYILMICPYSR